VRKLVHGLIEVSRFTGGAFGQSGYLLRCPATARVAFVDPGAVAPEMLRSLQLSGGELEAVYLTHAHVDHVEGVGAVRAVSDAPIYLHPEARFLYDRVPEIALRFGIVLDPLPPPDRDLVPGEEVSVGEEPLEVRYTPGHAPGHVIFYSSSAGLALVGDVIFSRSIGRTDLPGGDFARLMRSIREEVLTLPDDTRLLPGHGPETTVGDERIGNPFLISQAAGGFA
jgi:hydroxyacylglutathione hydrolase